MTLKIFPSEQQLDYMDCGPTCLKMVAKYYGRFYSLQFLREQCGISKEGVSLGGISVAAEKIGFRVRPIKCTIVQPRESIPLPCILHWADSHFVVLYKIGKSKFYISDPALGKVSYNEKDFVKRWIKKEIKKGALLALEPELDFSEIHLDEQHKSRKNYSSFLKYFSPYKSGIYNLMFVMLLVTLLQAALPFVSKAIIDVGIHTGDMGFIELVLFAQIIILLSTTLSNAIRDWITIHLTSRVNVSMISDYLVKLMKLPIAFFENKLIGDVLQRAHDYERIRTFIMGNALNMIFAFLTITSFGLILLFYNSKVFFVFMSGSAVYFTWVLGFLRIRKKLDTNFFNLTAQDQSYWVETVTAMQDIKVNNYEAPKRWKWENIQARLYKVNLKLFSITSFQNLGGQFIDGLKNLLITFFCANAVVQGQMTFGMMISTQIIIGMLNGPIQQFVQFIISAQMAKISFRRMNEIQLLDDEDNLNHSSNILLTGSKTIFVKDLSFQYAANHPFVLESLRLNIPQNKVTAIVGHSGCGKTTLLKLLSRLYKPTFGEILIGDTNINNVDLRQWRDRCGVVLQDGKIFNDTVLNNIVLDDENIDYEKLQKAVSVANISKEIEEMPLAYKTKMGEQGRGLSGGQRQRILIARALYKNPDYLFFDEATNSLDVINEQKIVESLEQVFKNKTVVVVAHRLSTIRKADQIVVMHKGRIVEVGNHDSLMEKKTYYYHLIEAQANLV